MESPEQYKARILGLMESKDSVTVQRETADQLARLIAGIPAEKLRQRSAPDKWSVAEILAHLSEAEIGTSWRYRQIVEHDGAPLSSYDQDLWESLGAYSSRDAEKSLQLFRLLREANLQMFDRLSPEQWQRYGMHAERGRMSVADLARQVAGHDINHIEQIDKSLGNKLPALSSHADARGIIAKTSWATAALGSTDPAWSPRASGAKGATKSDR